MKFSRQLCLLTFVIPFLMTTFISCGSDDPSDDIKVPEENEKPEKIEYYVKYESSVSIPSSNYIPIQISVVTEKGVQSLSVPRSWEGIFGPFNELKTLEISGGTSGYNPNMTSCRGRISICRGNQPFILKSDKSFRGTNLSVSYTVQKEDLK